MALINPDGSVVLNSVVENEKRNAGLLVCRNEEVGLPGYFGYEDVCVSEVGWAGAVDVWPAGGTGAE